MSYHSSGVSINIWSKLKNVTGIGWKKRSCQEADIFLSDVKIYEAKIVKINTS